VTQREANEAVRRLLEELVGEGQETGLQVAAYLDGHLAIDAWAGLADERDVRLVDSRTVFTAFSMSKGIVATCIHVLADRGMLDYDAPIARYWPEFAATGKERATVRHALTHQLGIPETRPASTSPGQMTGTLCAAASRGSNPGRSLARGLNTTR
jgi:CubicO group peptidase (beta-lactamase class C family)